MTTPLLHDTDLARIAPLSKDLKRSALWQMKRGFSTFSYKPVASSYLDIFNIQMGMFGATAPTPWKQIETAIIKASRSDEEQRNNIQVAKALHKFTIEGGVIGRKHDFFPMHIGVGKKVSLWLPMVLAVEQRPHVVFVDPRRTKGLTEAGRKFAFSMMHESIRVADADFADVTLGIIRFKDDNEKKEREVQLYTDRDTTLFSLDELEKMVAETYRLWQEVWEERIIETRRKGTGTGGLF